MAFTYINSVVGSDSPLNVSAGDLLVAWISWEDGSADTGCSDGDSNVFTTLPIINNTTNWGRFAYKISATANSSATINATGTIGAQCNIHILQFRPDSGEIVSLDFSTSGNTGLGTSFTSETFSSTGTDEIIVVGHKNYGGGTTFDNAAISGDAVDGGINSAYSIAAYWILAATVSSVTATATVYNDNWVSQVIGFKSEVTGGGSTALPRRILDGPFYGSLRGSVR